jgi:hypothetical protein
MKDSKEDKMNCISCVERKEGKSRMKRGREGD